MVHLRLLAASFASCTVILASAQPASAESVAPAPFEPDIVQCDRAIADTELRRQFPALFFQTIRRNACRCIKTTVGRRGDDGATFQQLAPEVVAQCVNGAIPSLAPDAVPKSVTAALSSAFDPKAPAAVATTKPKFDITTCQLPEYPVLALRAEVTGDTRIAFLVDGEGRVRESEITKPSGLSAEHKLLDATALVSFKRCRFTVDSSMGSSRRWVEIEYSWKLK